MTAVTIYAPPRRTLAAAPAFMGDRRALAWRTYYDLLDQYRAAVDQAAALRVLGALTEDIDSADRAERAASLTLARHIANMMGHGWMSGNGGQDGVVVTAIDDLRQIERDGWDQIVAEVEEKRHDYD